MKDHPSPALPAADEPPLPPATHKLTLRLLKTRRYPIPGFGAVTARLWRMRPADGDTPAAYAVSMTGLGARRFRILGGEEREATALFELLTRNTVTPIGLADVLEEHGVR